MRLFHFVEKHDRVRLAANVFGKLSTLLVADITRRGANQARDAVLFHVFRHVDAHHRAFVVE